MDGEPDDASTVTGGGICGFLAAALFLAFSLFVFAWGGDSQFLLGLALCGPIAIIFGLSVETLVNWHSASPQERSGRPPAWAFAGLLSPALIAVWFFVL